MGNTIIKQGSLVSGRNDFTDLHEKISGAGTKYLQMIATNYFGDQSDPLIYSVNIVDLRIESSFNDTFAYDVNKEITFTYKPIGTIEKTIHIKLDGEIVLEEVIPKNVSGSNKTFIVPPQTHGAHLIECWLSTQIGTQNIETDHIYKDIICFDKDSDVPVIGCIYRSDYYGSVKIDQHNTKVLPYVVYSNYTGDMQSNINITIEGDALDVQSNFSVTINGSVEGDVVAGNNVECSGVNGDLTAGNNITCMGVNGDITAGNNVECNGVCGNINAGYNISANGICGDVNAGNDLTCDEIKGNVNVGGNITCENIEADKIEVQGEIISTKTKSTNTTIKL